jgi:hypothetical protein
MSKELAVILLGAWVILLTQLGIPGTWRTTLLIITGVVIAVVGLYLRAEALSRQKRTARHTYVENGGPTHEEHERKEGIGSLN